MNNNDNKKNFKYILTILIILFQTEMFYLQKAFTTIYKLMKIPIKTKRINQYSF